MGQVSTYLNFERSTETAFIFYKSVFGGEFLHISRFGEIPPSVNMPPLPEADKNLIMHVALPIMDGHQLMGSDAPPSMGCHVTFGSNVYITLQPSSKEETQRLFKALSDGGTIEQDLQDMFWGDYFGSCQDKFGVHWMFNFTNPK